MASFDTFDALLAGTTLQAGFSQINIGGNFSVGGFAYEGRDDPAVPAVIPLPASGLLLLAALAFSTAFRRKPKR